MTALRYLWYWLGLLVLPLRLVCFYLHRSLIFISKPGARIILPVLMLSLGLLLRSQIDAVAGKLITDAFWDFREGSPEIFDNRIEITFGVCFVAAYIALLIAAKVMTPVVGALPAPRAPLVPQRPLIAREHKIGTVKASVAIGGSRSRFKGDLETLQRFLPDSSRAVLAAGRGREPEPMPQPQQQLEPEPMEPAAREPVHPVTEQRAAPRASDERETPDEARSALRPATSEPPEEFRHEAAPPEPARAEIDAADEAREAGKPQVMQDASRGPETVQPPLPPSSGPRRKPKRLPQPDQFATPAEGREQPPALTSGPRRRPRPETRDEVGR